jgi:hypothetical protein
MKESKGVKKVILAIAIAIILSFFVNLGIEVFYPSPSWSDYCQDHHRFMRNETECAEINGTWVGGIDGTDRAYCDTSKIDMKCSEEFEKNNEAYSKNVFIITLLLGIIIIGGSLFLSSSSVSSGLMAGGVIIIITGVMRYWRYSNDVLRFTILGIILAILIYIGYKKLN